MKTPGVRSVERGGKRGRKAYPRAMTQVRNAQRYMIVLLTALQVCQEVEEDEAWCIIRLQKGCQILYENPDGERREVMEEQDSPCVTQLLNRFGSC